MRTSTTPSAPDRPTSQPLAILRLLTHGAFFLFLILMLATHSRQWRYGPFTWGPTLELPALTRLTSRIPIDQMPHEIGVLTLIPLLMAGGWLVLRLAALRSPPGQRWSWGRPGIVLPLAGLTVLGLCDLELAFTWSTAFQLAAWGLTWSVYLFMVNERPDPRSLVLALAVVLILQGAVGVGQFLRQQDLGLAALGELRLDPATGGTSVLFANGQPWLRAYGLTGHPNLLAALLASIILMVLPMLRRATGWLQVVLLAGIAAGLLGLLATVSRGAWLGFAAGFAAWLLAEGRAEVEAKAEAVVDWNGVRSPVAASIRQFRWLPTALLALMVLGFFFFFRDLILSRFLDLDSAIEARSVDERLRDIGIALQFIAAEPLRGVGLGNFLPAARAVAPGAHIVHNVPLLVTAELGLPGGLLWLWLTLTPFFCARYRAGQNNVGKTPRPQPLSPRFCLVPLIGAWVAFVVIGFFHGIPWITTNWRMALLFALLVARL